MSDVVIQAEGLGKAYRLGSQESRSDTLVGAAAQLVTTPLRNLRNLRRLNTYSTDRDSADILWALKDVSFAIREGEVVGFVGRNGAGKSTLLKILSRITEPTEGRVTMKGRVSSLLEVGTGFHPELSGRENVYMNGTILGMRRREIDRKFDEIVEFSGIERFLDTPVKRYSSGMKVRLGFSVAAHLEPDVLIVDEVLAVGDAEFQRRCLGKMQSVAGSGRTVLFVSHNMGAIQTLCSRAIALRNGCVVGEGETAEVVRSYLASMQSSDRTGIRPDNPDRQVTGDVHLTDGRVLNHLGQPSTHLTAGEAMTFELDYENSKRVPSFTIVLEIRNGHGIAVHHMMPNYVGYVIEAERRGTIRCTLPRVALPIGDYTVRTAISIMNSKSDQIANALAFSVHASAFYPTGLGPNSNACAALTDQVWESTSLVEPAQEADAAQERRAVRIGSGRGL